MYIFFELISTFFLKNLFMIIQASILFPKNFLILDFFFQMKNGLIFLTKTDVDILGTDWELWDFFRFHLEIDIHELTKL